MVITDQFTKLTWAISLKRTTSTVFSEAFLNYWVFPYFSPVHLLKDDGSNLSLEFFTSVCTMVSLKHYFSTAYNRQTNGHWKGLTKP